MDPCSFMVDLEATMPHTAYRTRAMLEFVRNLDGVLTSNQALRMIIDRMNIKGDLCETCMIPVRLVPGINDGRLRNPREVVVLKEWLEVLAAGLPNYVPAFDNAFNTTMDIPISSIINSTTLRLGNVDIETVGEKEYWKYDKMEEHALKAMNYVFLRGSTRRWAVSRDNIMPFLQMAVLRNTLCGHVMSLHTALTTLKDPQIDMVQRASATFTAKACIVGIFKFKSDKASLIEAKGPHIEGPHTRLPTLPMLTPVDMPETTIINALESNSAFAVEGKVILRNTAAQMKLHVFVPEGCNSDDPYYQLIKGVKLPLDFDPDLQYQPAAGAFLADAIMQPTGPGAKRIVSELATIADSKVEPSTIIAHTLACARGDDGNSKWAKVLVIVPSAALEQASCAPGVPEALRIRFGHDDGAQRGWGVGRPRCHWQEWPVLQVQLLLTDDDGTVMQPAGGRKVMEDCASRLKTLQQLRAEVEERVKRAASLAEIGYSEQQ